MIPELPPGKKKSNCQKLTTKGFLENLPWHLATFHTEQSIQNSEDTLHQGRSSDSL